MRRTLFHRLPLLLLLLILPFGLAADSEALSITEGDYNSVSLYNPYGVRTDATASIAEDGYIIQTGATPAVFSSPFGDISASENTLIAVTGFNYDTPSLYILDGKAEIDLRADIRLTVYTSTASYTAEGEGTYSFIYTADEDKVSNESGSALEVFDPLRGRRFTLEAGDSVDMLLGAVTRYADTPLAEGSLPFMNWQVGYTLYPAKAVLTYPDFITESEAAAFFAYFAENEPALFEGVTYSFTAPGEAVIDYGTELDAGTQNTLVDLFASYLDKYAAMLKAEAERNSIRVVGTITYDVYRIGYDLRSEKGVLTYPSFATKADVGGFFAFLATENPGLMDGVSFLYTADGEVTISYGTALDEAELEYLVEVFEETLIKYIAFRFPEPSIPEVPSFTSVRVTYYTLLSGTISYAGYSVDYDLWDDIGILYYPSVVTEADAEAFFAYLAANEPSLLVGVSYRFIDGQRVVIDYGTDLDRAELEYLVDLFEAYLVRYIDGAYMETAEPEVSPVTEEAAVEPAVPATPATPAVMTTVTEPAVLLEGTVGPASYAIRYELTSTYGTLTYPAIITESDIEDFFAYLAANEPALLVGVTYSFTDGQRVVIDYGAELDRATLEYLVELFDEYLTSYLERGTQADTVEPETPAATEETVIEPAVLLEGTVGPASYAISYELTSTYGTLTYPALITESDIEDFFAYLAENEPALLVGVTYSFTDAGKVNVEYGTELTKAELENLVVLFDGYYGKYLQMKLVPAAPSFTDTKTEVIRSVPAAPGISMVKTTNISRVPSKPVLSATVRSVAPAPAGLTVTESEDSKKKITR